jgi:hypothetical protein
MVRAKRIELLTFGWKPNALPLRQARFIVYKSSQQFFAKYQIQTDVKRHKL